MPVQYPAFQASTVAAVAVTTTGRPGRAALCTRRVDRLSCARCSPRLSQVPRMSAAADGEGNTKGGAGRGDGGNSGGAADSGQHDQERRPSARPDHFVRVRVFSVGPPDATTAAALLTLLPEDPEDGDGFRTAFRMSVSAHQARAIRDLIVGKADAAASATSAHGSGLSMQGATQSGKRKHQNEHDAVPCYRPMRPTTHALFKALLDVQGGEIEEAAITHIATDVFIATILVRYAPLTSPGTVSFVALDARPSDAIAIAAQADAPLYLNRDLLRTWPVSVAAIQLDAAAGLCECIPPFLPLQELSTSHPTFADAAPSTTSTSSPSSTSSAALPSLTDPSAREQQDTNLSGNQVHETLFDAGDLSGSLPAHAPEYERLVKLYAHLDVAVRCERFREASKLRDEIDKICPLDRLRQSLEDAVASERFMDAAHLRDEIARWEYNLEQWESPNAITPVWRSVSDNATPSAFLPWELDRREPDVGWDPRIGGWPQFPGRPWVEYDVSPGMDYMDTSAHPPELGDQDVGGGNGDSSQDPGSSPPDPSS
jgi:bifunctional DNase/RNase